MHTPLIQVHPTLGKPAQQHKFSRTTATFLGTSLLLLTLAGCGSAPSNTSTESGSAPAAMPSPAMEAPAADIAQNLEAPPAPEPANTPKMPAVKPQLIRNGELVVEVKSVEEAIKAATKILKTQQGDLMGLQDSRPADDNAPYIVTMQIRHYSKSIHLSRRCFQSAR
jgi:hypothetical protein